MTTDSIGYVLESCYLLISHREKVRTLLEKATLTQNDIIDVLVSLHIVLEVGINGFFRQILPTTKGFRDFSFDETIKNLDDINFREKITMFLYVGSFDFSGKKNEAAKYHKIIGDIKNFSEMRNKLLHGHSISEWNQNDQGGRSPLKKNLMPTKVISQVKLFCNILEGVSFYFRCYTQEGITTAGKENYIKMYLDTSFLPSQYSDRQSM